MAVLTLSGQVVSASDQLTSSLFTMDFLETITTREVDIITISSGQSFTVNFAQVAVGKFLALTSDQTLSVVINGTATLAVKNIALSGASVTSLALTNGCPETATVQLAIGG
jgi:uncharacterized membrane protein